MLWTIQTAKMSRKTNEGFMINYKTIMANFSTIVRLLVEPITYLALPKDFIEAYLFIIQPP